MGDVCLGNNPSCVPEIVRKESMLVHLGGECVIIVKGRECQLNDVDGDPCLKGSEVCGMRRVGGMRESLDARP